MAWLDIIYEKTTSLLFICKIVVLLFFKDKYIYEKDIVAVNFIRLPAPIVVPRDGNSGEAALCAD